MKTLYLIGTPIGNLKDITLRAIETLQEIDLLLTENQSRAKKLLQHFNIKKKIFTLNEANFNKQKDFLSKIFNQNQKIGYLVSAGMPGISDPGNRLVKFVLDNFPEFKITVIPGVSALTSALALAPFPVNKFLFLGFLPKKKKRNYWLQKISQENLPVILFESPNRINKLLMELRTIGKKEVWLFRELTKIHEEFFVIDLNNFKPLKLKGEVVVVIPGFLNSDNVPQNE